MPAPTSAPTPIPTEDAPRSNLARGATLGPWIAAAAGPLAWFLQLTIGYALVPPAFRRGHQGALIALSAAALAIALGAVIAGARWRRVLPDGKDGGNASRYLVASAALVLGGVTALLIVCTALPIWLLGAGNEP
jgi:hypothetical protein